VSPPKQLPFENFCEKMQEGAKMYYAISLKENAGKK
jgi:hypothetical protein